MMWTEFFSPLFFELLKGDLRFDLVHSQNYHRLSYFLWWTLSVWTVLFCPQWWTSLSCIQRVKSKPSNFKSLFWIVLPRKHCHRLCSVIKFFRWLILNVRGLIGSYLVLGGVHRVSTSTPLSRYRCAWLTSGQNNFQAVQCPQQLSLVINGNS